MITDLNHRYFRFRIGDRWITLPQLGTSSKLWFYILKYKPHDVYFSETRFLNPQNIDKQKCPVILGSDFIIDCDRTTEDNVINIINKMWQLYKKKQIYIINTSKDSWQINFGKLDVELPQDYKLRGDAIKKRKKKIFDSLDGCEFDHLTDWKRIYRLPESPRYKDSKWGIVSYPSSGKLVSVMNGGVSIDEGTEQNGNLNSLPRQITSRKTECSVRSYARYTTNKKGNEYFPILKYVGRDYYKYKRDVEKLMGIYKISSYSSYATLYNFYFVLNKKMSLSRCNKVMKASRAVNKFCMEKFEKTLMMVSDRVCDGVVVDSKPQHIEGEEVIDVFGLRSAVVGIKMTGEAK